MERGFRGTLRIRALVLWTQFLAINNVNLYRPTSPLPSSAMSIANPTRTWCIFALSSPCPAIPSAPSRPSRYRHSRPEYSPRRTIAQPRTILKAHHPPLIKELHYPVLVEKKTSVYAHIANTPRWRKTRVSVCLSCDGEGLYEGSEERRIME